MNSTRSSLANGDPDRRRRLLVLVSAVLLLAYAAYGIQEAFRGRWAHLVSLCIASLTYLVLPNFERRLSAAYPERPVPRRLHPLRDTAWSIAVFLAIMAVFIIVNG